MPAISRPLRPLLTAALCAVLCAALIAPAGAFAQDEDPTDSCQPVPVEQSAGCEDTGPEDGQADDGTDDGTDWDVCDPETNPQCAPEDTTAADPSLPARVHATAKPVRLHAGKLRLTATCEPAEGCVAATYTMTVKGKRVTAKAPASEAGETSALKFKLPRTLTRTLRHRTVKATVTVPGAPAVRVKLRA